jgi:hypothetical protein
MELITLTGKDLHESFRELDRQLPQHAYKKIEGGKGGKLGLTDIIPAFLPDLLLELFGPIGYGWGFILHSMESSSKTVERAKGYTEEEVTATCQLSIWYRFLRDGEPVMSDPVPATGGSTNTLVEWAMKGALTNALGCAWFFAGYQLSVYKNERSHNGNGESPGRSQGAQQRQRSQPGGKQQQQQRPVSAHAEWSAAMNSIEQLLSDLNLARDRYWQYATGKYKAARDNITTEQLREQVALLSQCRQNNAKLEQFQKLLTDIVSQRPAPSDGQQGAVH